ncbi:MAG: hypothetical protein ACLUOI_11940 [Eisenbergiella sp.]
MLRKNREKPLRAVIETSVDGWSKIPCLTAQLDAPVKQKSS